MEYILDLGSFFSSISSLRYATTKTDTPFFNLVPPFPASYPIGRDVDIIVHPDDYCDIVNQASEFCRNQRLFYRTILDSKFHSRHRIETKDYFLIPNATGKEKLRNGLPLTRLHFQIDISSIIDEQYSGINVNPVLKSIENAKLINGVKVLDRQSETLMRCLFFAKSGSDHHRSYIERNKKHLNISDIQDRRILDILSPLIDNDQNQPKDI